MEIRTAGPEDIPKIVEIHVAASIAAYSAYCPPEVMERVTYASRLPAWQERFAREHLVLIARVGGIDAGYGYLKDSPEFKVRELEVPELSHLFVLPEYWNSGVGRSICDRICRHVVEHGGDRMRIWTFGVNTRALRAYQRWGFVLDGTTRQRNYEGVEMTEVRLEKPLV